MVFSSYRSITFEANQVVTAKLAATIADARSICELVKLLTMLLLLQLVMLGGKEGKRGGDKVLT